MHIDEPMGSEEPRPEFQFQLIAPGNKQITVKFHRDETIGILKVRNRRINTSLPKYRMFYRKNRNYRFKFVGTTASLEVRQLKYVCQSVSYIKLIQSLCWPTF